MISLSTFGPFQYPEVQPWFWLCSDAACILPSRVWIPVPNMICHFRLDLTSCFSFGFFLHLLCYDPDIVQVDSGCHAGLKDQYYASFQLLSPLSDSGVRGIYNNQSIRWLINFLSVNLHLTKSFLIKIFLTWKWQNISYQRLEFWNVHASINQLGAALVGWVPDSIIPWPVVIAKWVLAPVQIKW